MSTINRAVRLAVIIEAVSCLAMLYQSNPVSIWNSWCISLGWSTRAVSDVLVSFFFIVHFAGVFLFYHLFGTVGFAVYNGRLVFSSPVGFVVMLFQCTVWSMIFFGLLRLVQRLRLLFRHHGAEPCAPPNGGPAERSGNSGVSGGPPSVS